MKQLKALESNKKFIYLLCFLLPCLVMAVVYAAFRVFPFGDRTALVMDLNGQYADFFSYYHRVLTGGESLGYSFTKGLGGNVFGLFAYYLSSPFFLLALFFPTSVMPEGIYLVTILKIGSAGLSFAVFINYVFKKCDLSVLLFSVIYALMSYSMRYSMCVMWLDACIWLPIILIGAERVLNGKSPLVFIVSYALLMISNYYTCYMASLFTIIFFIYRYIARDNKKSVKDFFKKAAIMLGGAAVGVLLSSFILIPSFMDILTGKLSSASYTAEGFWNTGIFNILRRLFMGQYDSITNSGNPLIFCGMLCGLMNCVYFFNPKVKVRDKICALVVYTVLIVSFFIKKLDMAWHVFQYPNWFPYRYAFVFCFFSVFIAFQGFLKTDAAKKWVYLIGAAVYFLVLGFVYAFMPQVITNKTFAFFSIILAVFYAASAFVLTFKNKTITSFVCIGLIILSCIELGVNGFTEISGLDKEQKYKSRSEYTQLDKECSEAAALIRPGKNELFRSEKTFKRTDNDSMSYGYNGFTHYSSTYNSAVNAFNSKMGMLQEYILCRYEGSTVIIDSLLGFKKIASKQAVNDFYNKTDGRGGFDIYENPAVLPIAFAVPDSAQNPLSYKASSPLENQDEFAKSLLGRRFYNVPSNISQGSGALSFTSGGKPVYLSLAKKYSGNIRISVNGSSVPYEYKDEEEKKIFYIGEFGSGERVTITLDGGGSFSGAEIREFDITAFEDSISRVSERGLEITSCKDGKIEGRISADEKNNLMFTTIPYENGWKAYVDGKQKEIIPAQNTFIAVPVDAGEHTVKLIYHVPGLRLGIVLSVLTLLCLIAAVYRKNLLKAVRKLKDKENE